MDTSIKRLMEIAGVDVTQGKAKELCESNTSSSLCKEIQKILDSGTKVFINVKGKPVGYIKDARDNQVLVNQSGHRGNKWVDLSDGLEMEKDGDRFYVKDKD